MGCIKLDILENRYKTPELKIVYAKKELTSKKSSSEGRNYYHARYFDPRTSVFLGVDPLAEKYAGVSPFAYCLNNPIKYIDPDGRDIVLSGASGSSVTITTDLIDISVDASSLVGDLGGNYTFEGTDILIAGLDIVGIVDPTPISDGLAASLEAEQGNYGMAILSGLGVIPYVGDVAKVGKIPKHIKTINKAIDAVHGNSKLSKKAQHGYEIFNKKTNEILEYGISGQKRSRKQIQSGASPRINQKLRTKYDNDPNVGGRVTNDNLGNRQKALDWEQGKVNDFYKKHDRPPNRQHKPKPDNK